MEALFYRAITANRRTISASGDGRMKSEACGRRIPLAWRRLQLFAVLCLIPAGIAAASEIRHAGDAVIESPAWGWNTAPWDSEKVVTYGDYQYTIYWDADSLLTLGRRHIATNDIQRLRFSDARLSRDNGHHSTAIGISPHDGRLHLSYDQWATPLRYRYSTSGFLDDPPATLSASDFSGERSMTGQHEDRVTYPRFFNLNDGTLLFIHRYFTSQNGDHFLNRYDAKTGGWERVGMLFSRAGVFADSRIGTSTSRCAYLNDVVVDRRNRIHLSWTWREGPGHETNHDLHYIYSDDGGNTWRNNAGRTIANLPAGIPVRVDSLGIRVAEIPTYSWLINQDAMAVDSRDQPHVVTHHSTVPAEEAGDRNLHYIHYWREAGGQWRSRWIDPTEIQRTSFRRRGTLAIDPDDNLHFLVIDGGLRYFHAAGADDWDGWTEHSLGAGYSGQGLRYDRRLWEKNQVLYASAVRGGNSYVLPIFQWDRPEPRVSLGTFDEPGGLDDWRLVKQLTGDTGGGSLQLTFGGSDPYLRRGGLGIDADRYRFLLLRMKHTGSGSEGAVFFVTHDDFGWSYSKARMFSLGEPDGRYHDYLIDLAEHSRWKGGVPALRIDPVENARAGDTAAIERVVLFERTPFEQWRLNHFSEEELADETISGPGAAPAGDGVPNLMKHALGLDPHEPSGRSALPRVLRTDTGGLQIEYRRPKETALRYIVELSTDLKNWKSGPGETELVALEDLGVNERVTVRDSRRDSTRRFIRLRVEPAG